MNYVSMDFNICEMIVSSILGASMFSMFDSLYSTIFDVLMKIFGAY